jgi:hypothetical protein
LFCAVYLPLFSILSGLSLSFLTLYLSWLLFRSADIGKSASRKYGGEQKSTLGFFVSSRFAFGESKKFCLAIIPPDTFLYPFSSGEKKI